MDDAVRHIRANMVSAEKIREDTWVVRLPLIYTGGSMVAVFVRDAKDGMVVSDHGFARQEIDMCGSDLERFDAIANRIANNGSADYENGEFKISGVTPDQLESSIGWVAYASQGAVMVASFEDDDA